MWVMSQVLATRGVIISDFRILAISMSLSSSNVPDVMMFSASAPLASAILAQDMISSMLNSLVSVNTPIFFAREQKRQLNGQGSIFTPI